MLHAIISMFIKMEFAIVFYIKIPKNYNIYE